MRSYIKRKERIILTAIDIISDLGFQGFTTKEICRRQEIADGTLYKHFRSKNEIILGVLDHYSKFDESIKDTIELNKLSAKESINFFLEMQSQYYENYPAITAISNLYETLQHEANISEKAKEIFQTRSKIIMYYIEKGKRNGEIKFEIDSEGLADMILGTIREIILKWRMSKFNFPLKERVMLNLDMILKLC